jgi:trimethylamine--corrinoid protein Co-methyltransferase
VKRNPQAGVRRNAGPSFGVLTDDELADIHLGTLEVLERTGVFVEDEAALDVFADGGASIDRAARIACLPPCLVEDAIHSAPAKVVLCGRDPANDIVLEGGRVGFTNFGEGIQVVDPRNGELRPSTKADVAESARLVDALPELDVYERALAAHDVSAASAPLHQAEAWFANTAKHGFMGSQDGYLSRQLFAMAAMVAGGEDELRARPLISWVTCPVSPLKLTRESCEIITEAARCGIVVNILSMAMAGGSSPVTLAGTLVTHNAEVLAGVTLAQLVERGAPVIYGSSTTALDLRLAAASVGSPECALISSAVAQLARFYLLPSWVAGL